MADLDEAEPRVRYFDGQLLTVSELTDEQDFHRLRHERHARQLHTPGIARGLEVRKGASQEVSVSPGVAVDARGRQLILEAETRLTVPHAAENRGLLVISFKEADGKTDPESGKVLRYVQDQKAMVEFVKEQEGSNPEKYVVLARVTESNGQAQVDERPRRYAGIRLPGSGEQALTLRAGRDGANLLALLEGAFQVRAAPSSPTALKVSTGDTSLLEVGGDGRVALGSKTTVDKDGFILSGKWRVTAIRYRGTKTGGVESEPLRLRASFDYQGGTLLLLASGSARRMERPVYDEKRKVLEETGDVTDGPIGMTLKLNDKPVGACRYWVKPDVTTHYPFSTTAVIPLADLVPGPVKLELERVDPFTKIDEEDLFTVTVLELPISTQTHLKFSVVV
ncbi:hypothetical protein [Corallococcus sp. 4LFB]|uniref:hypothetical protein n=1 Tax=Corallococcus sp. 4LFB TaxID=3383249 RepID=UPI0039758A01